MCPLPLRAHVNRAKKTQNGKKRRIRSVLNQKSGSRASHLRKKLKYCSTDINLKNQRILHCCIVLYNLFEYTYIKLSLPEICILLVVQHFAHTSEVMLTPRYTY